MNKLEFVRAIVKVLKDNGTTKHVGELKSTLSIVDEDGSSKKITLKKKPVDVFYSNSEVEAFVDAALDVLEESIIRDNPISIRGFGECYLELKPERTVMHPLTKEPCKVPEKYVIRIKPGKRLMIATRLRHLAAHGFDIDGNGKFDINESDEIFSEIEAEEEL